MTTEPARTEVPLAENEQAAPVVDGAESEETTTSTTTVYSISTLFETVIVQPTDASGNQATVTGGAEGVGATAVASNESQVDGPVCSPAAGCFPVTVTVTEPAACVAPTASVTETSTVTMTQTASTVTVVRLVLRYTPRSSANLL